MGVRTSRDKKLVVTLTTKKHVLGICGGGDERKRGGGGGVDTARSCKSHLWYNVKTSQRRGKKGGREG